MTIVKMRNHIEVVNREKGIFGQPPSQEDLEMSPKMHRLEKIKKKQLLKVQQTLLPLLEHHSSSGSCGTSSDDNGPKKHNKKRKFGDFLSYHQDDERYKYIERDRQKKKMRLNPIAEFSGLNQQPVSKMPSLKRKRSQIAGQGFIQGSDFTYELIQQ